MATPTTLNLGLNKVDRSSPTTTYVNLKTLIDDNMDALDAAVAGKAPKDNPVFTGSGVTLPADPTAAMHAATKQWVDSKIASIPAPTASNIPANGSTTVQAEIDSLKSSVSSGKTAVAAAITGKNQVASGSDTFATLASKITAISSDATAVAGDIYTGKTAYSGGLKIIGTLQGSGTASDSQVLTGASYYNTDFKTKRTGTMPNNGAVTIMPGPSAQTIPAGYHNGSGVVPAVNVPAAKVLAGTTIAGTAGTMPYQGSSVNTNSHSPASNVSVGAFTSGNPNIRTYLMPPEGYYNGTTQWVVQDTPNLVSGNIAAGISILGVTGTFQQLCNLTSALQKGQNGTTWVLQRRVTMAVTTTIACSIDLYNSNVNGYCYGQWYKNGVAFGGQGQSNSQTRVKLTSVTSCVPGDVIELYTSGQNSSAWGGNENMVITGYVAAPSGGTINIA